MLDLLTLQKTRNWLIKRHDDIPTEWGAESMQYQINIGKRHFIFDLIQELDEKINAIQVEQTIRPAENGVMLIKNTNFGEDTNNYLPSFVKYEENPDIFTSDNP